MPLDLNGPVDCAFDPLPAADIALPIGTILARTATRYASRAAIDDGQVRLSYAEMLAMVRRVSAAICAAAPAPERAVALALSNSAFFHVGLLGCLAAGRPAVPLDPNWPPQRRAEILHGASAAVVLVDPAAGEAPPAPVGALCLDVRRIAKDGEIDDGRAVSTLEPAIVLYTSGSTGRPKGIVNHQRALMQRVAQYANAVHLHPEDRFLTLSTPCTIAGLRESLTALLVGGTLHVADFHRLGVGGALHRLRQSRITIFNSVPAVLRLLLQAPDAAPAFASVRTVRTGGEVTFWSDVDRLRRRLPNHAHIQIGFSSTEATGTQWFVPARSRQDGPRVPVGYVLPGNRYALLDDGRLLLRGTALALGHWEGGRCVPGPIQADPDDPQARIFDTGDRMRLVRDGLLDALGRADDQVKISGQRVEPSELEAALRDSPGVADAAVLVRRDAPGRAALVAFFAPSAPDHAESLAAGLRVRLQGALPSAMQPARIHALAEIPRLPSAKANRSALEALDRACVEASRRPARAAPGIAPILVPEMERAFMRAWRCVLDDVSLAADLPFREAGGDSLDFLHLVHELERQLGVPLPLERFDPGMRPSGFRRALSGAMDTESGDERAAEDETRPLVCLMPGVGGDEPLLSLFRATVKDALRFTLIRFPGWRAMARPGFTFEDLVASAAAQVDGAMRADGGPVRLAGYSFGGRVAFAVAAHLRREGQAVRSVCLFDCPATLPPMAVMRANLHARSAAIRLRNLLRIVSEGRIVQRYGVFAGELLSREASAPLLHRLARRGRLPVPTAGMAACAARLERLMRLRLGQEPLRSAPLEGVDVTLFRSAAHARHEAWDLGWTAQCAHVRVVPVEGTHHSMFQEGNGRSLADRLLEAV